MILYINTMKFGVVEFSLEKMQKIFRKSYKIVPQESDKILEYLEAFLKAAKIKNPKSVIKKIVVIKKKTGSFTQRQKSSVEFTGLRITAAIAQALSLAWQVPIKIL